MKSILIVLLCILLYKTTGAGISLNSTLIRGMFALPNQEVTFTCVSRNATVVNWNSTEYIGAGNVFPISSFGPARNRTRGTTVATRLETYVEGGSTVIISQLHITASEVFPNSAVTCRVNGDGPSETIHFITTENALQEVSLNSTLIRGMFALPNQEVTFTCVSRNATVVNWNSTEYIGAGNVFPISSFGPARNRTRGTTVATRFETYVDDGSTVIISQLHITASEEFPSSAVTCRVNGDGPSETIHFITTEIAGTTTSAVETMDISNNGNDNSSFVTTNNYKSTQESAMCSGFCGFGIGVGVLFVVFIGVVAIVSIVIVKRIQEDMKINNKDIESKPGPQKDGRGGKSNKDEIKQQQMQPENEVIGVTADKDHSGTGDSGVDDSSNGSGCEMESKAIIKKREQVGEAYSGTGSGDSGVDDSSNGSGCEMEDQDIEEHEQGFEAFCKPSVDETNQDSKDDSVRKHEGIEDKKESHSGPGDSGVACGRTSEEDLQHNQYMFEPPPKDLVTFKGPAPDSAVHRDPDVTKNPHPTVYKAVGGLVGVGGVVSGVVGVVGGVIGGVLGIAVAVIGVVCIIKKESNERKKKEEEKKTTPDLSPKTNTGANIRQRFNRGPIPDPAVPRDPDVIKNPLGSEHNKLD